MSEISLSRQRLGRGWNQWPLKCSLRRWHLSRGKSCPSPLSNDKQEAAKETWGQSIPVQSKQKSAGPHIGTSGNTCREAGSQRGEMAAPQRTPGSQGPVSHQGELTLYSSRTKYNTRLKLSSWGERKKHWEIAHSIAPPPKAVAIKSMVLICKMLKITKLYCLWSENHAEF